MDNEKKSHKDYHISDRLANERTFLAWLRTSLGLIAFGFVIEKFALFSNQVQEWLHSVSSSSPIGIFNSSQSTKITVFGIFIMACGSFLSLFAFYKYMRLEQQITNETYTPSHMLEGVLAFLFFMCGIFLMLDLIFG